MFYRILSRLIEIAIIIGIAFIVTIVTSEVVLRYVFKHSLIFTEELSRYLMVWIVFLGSALAIRDEAHIRINILVKRLNPTLRKAANVHHH
jgi:TRAP-type C4-dicarboxylate transport system permease small subunit